MQLRTGRSVMLVVVLELLRRNRLAKVKGERVENIVLRALESVWLCHLICCESGGHGYRLCLSVSVKTEELVPSAVSEKV